MRQNFHLFKKAFKRFACFALLALLAGQINAQTTCSIPCPDVCLPCAAGQPLVTESVSPAVTAMNNADYNPNGSFDLDVDLSTLPDCAQNIAYGLDITIDPNPPSWTSELSIDLYDVDGNPLGAAGSNMPGTASSSATVILPNVLTGTIPTYAGADGLWRLDIFDNLDDGPVDGNLAATLRVTGYDVPDLTSAPPINITIDAGTLSGGPNFLCYDDQGADIYSVTTNGDFSWPYAPEEGVAYLLYNQDPTGLDPENDSPNFSTPTYIDVIGSAPAGCMGSGITGTFENVLGGNQQYWVVPLAYWDECPAGFFQNPADPTDCQDVGYDRAVSFIALDEITTQVDIVCSGSGQMHDVTFSDFDGGIPGYDNIKDYTVAGDGPGGTVPHAGMYVVSNVAPGTTVTITVADANGCSTSFSATTPAAIMPSISGLASSYCANDAPVMITGNPTPTPPGAGAVGSIVFSIEGDLFSGGETSAELKDGGGNVVADYPVGSFPNFVVTTKTASNLPLADGPYRLNISDSFGDGLIAGGSGTVTVNDGQGNSLFVGAFTSGTSFSTGALPALALDRTFTGSFAGPGVIEGAPNDGQATFDPGAASPGTHAITYTVTTTDGCTATATENVVVFAPPMADITIIENSEDTPNDGIICNGDMVTLTATPGGLNYQWDADAGSSTSQTVMVTPTMDTDYTVLVTDGNMCTGEATVSITLDHEDPVPACLPYTAYLDGNGDATVVLTDVYDMANSTDNCGTVNVVSFSPIMYTCADLGPKNVMITVNDGNGNTGTCTAIVTVADNIPPVPTCQPFTYTLDATGVQPIALADIYTGGTDNCLVVDVVSIVPPALTCDEIGDNTVTVNVKDASDNPASCTSTVTILAGPYFTWYKDTDDDGYSDGAVIEGCTAPPNYKLAMDLTATSGDCNDSNPFVHPDRFEECNGFDDDCDGTVDENPVTDISIDLFPGCDDMGTSDPSDDTFTALVSVEFDDVPPNGVLSISGDATASVPVGSLVGSTSHTFTNVLLVADGGPISISASFSATGCVFMAPNLGPAPESCSNCSIVGISVSNADNCDANGNTDASDDTFTADVTVDFLSPPMGGTLDLTGDGSASVPVGSLSGSSYTFTGVEMTADGGPIALTASFSDMSCPLTVADAGTALPPCCFVEITTLNTTDEECGGGATLEFVAVGTGTIRYSIDGGATWQLSGIFTDLSSGDYDVVAQVLGQGCTSPVVTIGITIGGTAQTWYKDIDGDGYTDGMTLTQCTQPTGYVASALPGDCNDYDADEFPGQMWYADLDGDGYTDGTTLTNCSQPTGYVLSALPGDCDDTDATIYDGAPEICDGIDNDCDGDVDEGGGSGLTYVGSLLFTTQAQVDAFSQCYSVIDGNLTVQGSVYDLSNLINIVEVTGNVYIKSSDLMSMAGLDNLSTIGGYLKIRSNGDLTTLDGLQGVTSVGGYLKVYYNGGLTDCCAIHPLLGTPGAIGGSVNIFRNDTGCDDEGEIDMACGGGEALVASPGNGGIDIFASQNTDNQDIMIYPNPTSGGFNLRFAAGYTTASVQVYDLRGSLVLSQIEVSGTPNIRFEKGGLTSGIYLVKAIVDGEIFTQKLMVEE